MDMVDTAITQYALEHTSPPTPHLAALAEETRRTTPTPAMMSGLAEVALLEALVVATGATRVLEVGTFTGYGALAMAARLPAGGRLTTLERDERHAAIARRHIEASPDAAKIDLLIGDAREIVPSLPGPFDVVYIDAWKPDYAHYFDAVLPKLAERGVIVADNVLWNGEVLEETPEDERTAGLKAFNDRVQADPRVHNVLLTIGDGFMLAWRA
jgi:caffeoyl-CoA O-methyltransferase